LAEPVPAIRAAGPLAWRLGLAVLFVGLIALYVEIPAVIAHLTPAMLWAAIAMQPLLALGLVLAGTRLMVLAGRAGLGRALRAVILCNGLNVVIPGRLSELVKVAHLREHGGLQASESLAAVVLERALDFLMLGMLALLAMTLLLVEVSGLVLVAMAGAAALLVALPLWSAALVRALRKLPLGVAGRFVERSLTQAAERARTPSLWIALGLSVAIWTLAAVAVHVFLGAALGDRAGLPQALLVLAAVLAGASIPGLPGGFGAYEVGGVLALRSLGLGVDEALALAFALHLGQLFLAVALSLLLLLVERTGVASLVRSAREALRGK
jgi:uncharacterized membrane protein YbhN (UPF0104 family)